MANCGIQITSSSLAATGIKIFKVQDLAARPGECRHRKRIHSAYPQRCCCRICSSCRHVRPGPENFRSNGQVSEATTTKAHRQGLSQFLHRCIGQIYHSNICLVHTFDVRLETLPRRLRSNRNILTNCFVGINIAVAPGYRHFYFVLEKSVCICYNI